MTDHELAQGFLTVQTCEGTFRHAATGPEREAVFQVVRHLAAARHGIERLLTRRMVARTGQAGAADSRTDRT